MKKILFAAYSLDIGGIEKALITLVNFLHKKGYNVTLVLEKKQGIFLESLNKKINVIEYTPDKSTNMIKRKLLNLIKRIKFIFKYKNKFDFSASFATYSNMASFVARTASKNNCIWGHSDYLTLFDNNIEKLKEFFNEKKVKSFKKIVFVSRKGANGFIKVYPELKEKVCVCNNLIDDENILKLSEKKIDLVKDNKKVTFINVGRHIEIEKKLTRIIEASKKLKSENKNFKVLLIGDGQDSEFYKELVKKENLEDTIILLGKKQNPYPYFKISDCVLLTSDYEGYPVVFLESFVLGKPIITTKVSDYEEVEQGYGMLVEKDAEDVYEKMKQFIENGFTITKKFDSNKYNEDIYSKLQKILEG